MANKNILIEVKVNDKASPQIKNTSNAVDKLAKSVDLLSKSEQEEFVIAEKSRIKKTAQIQGLKQEAAAQLQVEAAKTKNNATSGLNNAILLETGRLASDASYGFQGIANNLGQLISLFQISAKNAGGFLANLKQLGRSMLGTGGLLIGIQLLISFLPQLERLFNRNSKEAKRLAKEIGEASKSIQSQIDLLKEFTKIMDETNLGVDQLRETVKILSSEFPDFKKLFDGLDSYDESSVKNLILDFKNLKNLELDIVKLRTTARIQRENLLKLNKEEGADKAVIKNLEIEQLVNNIRLTELIKERVDLIDSFKDKTVESIGIEDGLAQTIEFNLDKQKNLLIEINDLKLEGTKFIDIDPEMEKDNFLLQFKIKNIQEEIEAKRKASLQELDIYYKDLDNFTFIESEKAKINAFYNKEQADAAIKSGKDFDDLQLRKLAALATFTEGFSQLLGEQSAAGKAFASATALIDTYAAVMQVWSDKSLPYAFKVIASAGVLATGISNVQKINAVDVSGRGQTGAAGGTINAPDFNVVGTSETSQLAQAVGQTSQSQVIKAYVVGSEITSQQEFDRKITNTAGL